jgi:hypothetical protein
VVEAYRANALFDAHREDPECGRRLLAGEARNNGEAMSDRTAWRLASQNGWISAFGKPKRGKHRRPGSPVHDDRCAVIDERGRVRHVFAADAPNELWLTDITEHKTAEGKIYLCAIKDVYSGRIADSSSGARPAPLPRRSKALDDYAIARLLERRSDRLFKHAEVIGLWGGHGSEPSVEVLRARAEALLVKAQTLQRRPFNLRTATLTVFACAAILIMVGAAGGAWSSDPTSTIDAAPRINSILLNDQPVAGLCAPPNVLIDIDWLPDTYDPATGQTDMIPEMLKQEWFCVAPNRTHPGYAADIGAGLLGLALTMTIYIAFRRSWLRVTARLVCALIVVLCVFTPVALTSGRSRQGWFCSPTPSAIFGCGSRRSASASALVKCLAGSLSGSQSNVNVHGKRHDRGREN